MTDTRTTQIKTWQDLGALGSLYDKFKQMHKNRSLPHVLLLDGVEALEKERLAAGIAGFYYCEHQNGCGQCRGCRLVLQGLHPDLLWIEVDSSMIKLEYSKALQDHLLVKPGRSFAEVPPVRLAVVVDIDKFSVQAANRLLKILEEPPEYARVVLTTSRRHAVLETISSRCVRWQLKVPSNLLDDPASRITSDERRALLKLFTTDDMAERVMISESIVKELGLSAADIAIKGEIVFNELLKELAVGQARLSWAQIKSIRSALADIKQIAVRKKISLNPTLSAEGIGVSL